MASISSSSSHSVSGAATAIPSISTSIIESPALAPCPLQLSEEAFAAFAHELPPLDESRMTPALASTAAALREKFTSASSDAQALLRTMHEIRMEWNHLPVVPAGFLSWPPHCRIVVAAQH